MLGTALLLAGGDSYSIPNGIRLNGTSDYLSKTLTTSSTTSGSIWIKRAKLGAISPVFDNKVYFTSGDALYAFGLTSTALYRDPLAWTHIFWNGTGVYVNGTLVTGSGSYTSASVTNPRLGYDGTNYFSGCLSDFALWNGSSASLQGGATDANGVWAPRRPSAGYSFLAFGSSGALGTDTSGNGNNWTVNGSPTQTTDTPSNNFATWNPIDTAVTLSSGATIATTVADAGVRASHHFDISGGGIYAEFTWSATSGTGALVGISSNNVPLSGANSPLSSSNYIFRLDTGSKYNGTTPIAYGSSASVGNTIGIAVKNGSIWFSINNVWQNSGNPVSGINPAFTGLSGIFTFYTGSGNANQTITANFGATNFAYTPPTGFKSLCAVNMPSTSVTTSGTFTGNASADGPFIWTNGNPATLTINGNAVTFGTHADKAAGGFKLRTSSSSYNTSGSNTWTATAGKRFVYSATSINTAQGNP